MIGDLEFLNKQYLCAQENRCFATAVITKISGSTPGKVGSMMLVYDDGSFEGTLGGGNFEKTVIENCVDCIKVSENKLICYDMSKNGDLGMVCGGSSEVFIKVFRPKKELILVGGGHIAEELYKLGRILDFHITVFEDREEYGNSSRFPEAKIMLGSYEKLLCQYNISKNCSIVIVTKGHRYDEEALKAVIDSRAAYIGMIGSRSKVLNTLQNLRSCGIEEENLKKVYAPIGLAIGGDTPSEIALSIMAEIVAVNNEGRLEHLRIC